MSNELFTFFSHQSEREHRDGAVPGEVRGLEQHQTGGTKNN